ncbi:MAG: hypothetical protein JWN31_462 [Frankiales bacterium]|nr:hypothetical protein [Frankiales bacterium]
MTDGPAQGARKWLETNGYPLEMRVAKAFREAGANVTASDHYIDPETDKGREIDVVAYRHVVADNRLALIVSAVVECKNVPSGKQWVAFQGDGILPGMLIYRERVASPLGDAWLRGLAESHDVPILNNTVPHAHGITTTHQDGSTRDTAYQAVTGAVHAAVARANRWKAAPTSSADNYVAGVALPVVVLSGDLLVAKLDDADELQVEPCDHLLVTWREPIAGRELTLVNVVTENALPDFARDFVTTANALTTDRQSAAQRALAKAHEPPSFANPARRLR